MELSTVKRRALEPAVLLWSGLLLSSSAAAESRQRPVIEREALEKDIRYLASDQLAGRGNGSPELEEAARFIARRFEDLGLEPAGDAGGYFQPFRVMTGQEVGRLTEAVLRIDSKVLELHYPADFEPLTFSASGELTGPVVFVGYGVTAPEHDYDDYASVDVRGKIVLVLRYAPEPFGKHGWHATFVRKAQNAIGHGARALVVFNGPLERPDDKLDKLVPFGADVGSRSISIPVLHLKRRYAEEILERGGRDLLELQTRIAETLTPRSFEVPGVRLRLTVDLRRTAVEVENVLAWLPATKREENANAIGPRRPSAEDEYVVIGAHYDHIGRGERGSRDRRARGVVHNGADDNASGVAGLLELARIFHESAPRRRGILFAAFAGEELGLRGSSFYIENPTRPLEDAILMLNLDMIGRLRHDRLYLGGLDSLPDLRREVLSELSAEALSVSGRLEADESSDHEAFLRAGVPALLLFTGLHGDYHKPTDDSQFINLEGMERVLRVSYRLSDYLLRAGERPRLVANGGGLEPAWPNRKGGEASAYFGVGIDASFQGEGIRFAYVAEDGPAAKAGLQAGDVLLEIDGRAIVSTEKAASILLRQRPGETVSAKVRRNDQILEVLVRLSSWP